MTRYPRRRRTLTATLVMALEEAAIALAGSGLSGDAETEVVIATVLRAATSAAAIVGKRKGFILSCHR